MHKPIKKLTSQKNNEQTVLPWGKKNKMFGA